jgi:opacity protein-like surface antigen
MHKTMLACAALLIGSVATVQASTADQLNAQVLQLLRPAPAVVSSPAPVSPAAPRNASFYVGANMGQNWQVANNYTVGAVAGYRFNSLLGAEVTYDYVRNNSRAAFRDAHMFMINGVISHDLGLFGLTPYALAGVGVGWNGMGMQNTGSNQALWNVGTGVRVNLVNSVDLDTRYRYLATFERQNNPGTHMVTLGVNFRF